MTFHSISALAAGTAPAPIPSFIPDTTISTRVSASRGRMATRFCAREPASTTPMARIDDQNLPINNTVDRYTFSNTQFPGACLIL